LGYYPANHSPDYSLNWGWYDPTACFSIGYENLLEVSKLGKHDKKLASSFSNSIVLTNNGNVGIPVNDLAFHHNPLALSVQMMVVLFELFITFTYGLINASAASMGLKKTTIQFIQMPVLYCLVLGLLFNQLHITLPDFV
jgi:predicted permease